MNEQKPLFPVISPAPEVKAPHNRRRFLGIAGALAGAGLIGLSSCKKDETQQATEGGVDLGSGENGVLNYVYALKQLTNAFYKEVISSSESVFPEKEMLRLKEISAHENAHARFLQDWMKQLGMSPIQDLTPNFSTVNFSDRIQVLQTAQTLEDLSVAACNGAGKLFTSARYLVAVGKMGSVDARHAAFVHDLQSDGSFADLTALAAMGAEATNGLDVVLAPTQVIGAAGKYIRQRINASKLPSY